MFQKLRRVVLCIIGSFYGILTLHRDQMKLESHTELVTGGSKVHVTRETIVDPTK